RRLVVDVGLDPEAVRVFAIDDDELGRGSRGYERVDRTVDLDIAPVDVENRRIDRECAIQEARLHAGLVAPDFVRIEGLDVVGVGAQRLVDVRASGPEALGDGGVEQRILVDLEIDPELGNLAIKIAGDRRQAVDLVGDVAGLAFVAEAQGRGEARGKLPVRL